MSEEFGSLDALETRSIWLMVMYNYDAKALALVAAGLEVDVTRLRAEVERLTADLLTCQDGNVDLLNENHELKRQVFVLTTELEERTKSLKAANEMVNAWSDAAIQQNAKVNTLAAERDALLAANRWIPARERYPTNDKIVNLVYRGEVCPGYWTREDAGDREYEEHLVIVWYLADLTREGFRDIDGEPDCWMPLPEPPQDGQP